MVCARAVEAIGPDVVAEPLAREPVPREGAA
jgi:hypothetical protein